MHRRPARNTYSPQAISYLFAFGPVPRTASISQYPGKSPCCSRSAPIVGIPAQATGDCLQNPPNPVRRYGRPCLRSQRPDLHRTRMLNLRRHGARALSHTLVAFPGIKPTLLISGLWSGRARAGFRSPVPDMAAPPSASNATVPAGSASADPFAALPAIPSLDNTFGALLIGTFIGLM